LFAARAAAEAFCAAVAMGVFHFRLGRETFRTSLREGTVYQAVAAKFCGIRADLIWS
jgi:hypothetical protein